MAYCRFPTEAEVLEMMPLGPLVVVVMGERSPEVVRRFVCCCCCTLMDGVFRNCSEKREERDEEEKLEAEIRKVYRATREL